MRGRVARLHGVRYHADEIPDARVRDAVLVATHQLEVLRNARLVDVELHRLEQFVRFARKREALPPLFWDVLEDIARVVGDAYAEQTNPLLWDTHA